MQELSLSRASEVCSVVENKTFAVIVCRQGQGE
jgi:hypothetical protein